MVLLTILAVFPTTGWAQGRFNLFPSIAVNGVYDDNLFYSIDDPTQELYARLTPSLALNYGVTRSLTINSSYSFDAEVFPNNADLNRAFARQRAMAGLQHRINRLTNWSFFANYTNTNTPRDLLPDAGLDFRRRSATAYNGIFTFDRQLARRDTLNVNYTIRRVEYTVSDTLTQILSFGWTHQFSPRTGISLSAGPNFTEGLRSAFVSASFDQRFPRTTVSATFSRRQNPIPSLARLVLTESLVGSVTQRLTRNLQLSIAPGVSRNSRDGLKVYVYRMNFTLTYPVNRMVSLSYSYRGSYQDGTFNILATDESVTRNEMLFGITIGLVQPII